MRRIVGSLFTMSVLLCGCQDAEVPPRERQEVSQTEQQPSSNGTEGERTVTSDEVAREIQDALETAGQFAAETRDEIHAKLSKQLEEHDKEIEDMKQKGRELRGEAKENWDRQMENLEAERETLRENLEELRSASQENWREVREETNKAWDDFRERFNAARNELTR